MEPAGIADKSPNGMEVLNRSVAVLSALATGPGTIMSLAEVCRRTGLPKATAHRFLASLVSVGFVERNDPGYQLGIKLFELGEQVPLKRRLRETALPFLQDLYEITRHTVHLAVLEGADVVYLERLHGHRALRVASKVGGRQPAYCTAVGKVLLAYAEGPAPAPAMQPRTPYTIADPFVLRRQLDQIRESGVAVDREENALGVHCVAAPVLIKGQAVAAVSVSSPTESAPYELAVRTAALGIARRLDDGAWRARDSV